MPRPFILSDEIVLYVLAELAAAPELFTTDGPDPYIHVRDFTRLNRVSRQFRRLAEPLLYNRLWDPRSLKLLRTFCEWPELALHVKKIDAGH